MNNCNLILGDCLKELKKLPNESVDLCLTDPPYGLEFMGKEWDKWEDSFTEKWAEAVMPKLKAGAFLVFTMSPRQDLLWRCLAGLEKAGFVLGASGMYWLYHTGFPKAMDIGKSIDKLQGNKREVIGEKDGTYADIRRDKNTGVAELHGGIATGKPRIKVFETKGNSVWEGYKSFSLKPAVECIVVAQKPRTEKTIAGQVLANGCGAVNVEACRIPFGLGGSIAENPLKRKLQGAKINYGKDTNPSTYLLKKKSGEMNINEAGRFPANLIVSGEPLEGETRGIGHSQKIVKGFGSNDIYGFGKGCDSKEKYFKDGESANRFYSLDAWARKRNITLTGESAFFDVPKPSKAEKNFGLDGFEKEKVRDGRKTFVDNAFQRGETLRSNKHPTCKPVKLFAYLSELFCQPNGLILDPFMGSGTTGIAALKVNKRFVGIEKEEEYFKTAEARIKPFREQTKIGGKVK